ncbi:hypothetical protein V494_07852 [Pseudogymnoascus sp. VKM F-4513 (FW-928)]|nr:hypothetical protein V494_07852 [Pseudogymnoascus sp. VKM F-4513 (FW-928)]
MLVLPSFRAFNAISANSAGLGPFQCGAMEGKFAFPGAGLVKPALRADTIAGISPEDPTGPMGIDRLDGVSMPECEESLLLLPELPDDPPQKPRMECFLFLPFMSEGGGPIFSLFPFINGLCRASGKFSTGTGGALDDDALGTRVR